MKSKEPDRRFRHVRFRGMELLLVGWEHGPLATPEQYASGEDSYADLQPGGRVMRYGEQIGTRDDVEFGGEALAPIPEPGAVKRLLGSWGGWFDEDEEDDDE